MRRLLSILLLLLFAAPAAQPMLAAALQGGQEKSLPACCRRNGEHKCMLTAEQRAALSDYVATISADTGACPYTAAPATAATVAVFTPAAPPLLFRPAVSASNLPVHAELCSTSAGVQLHPQRGPPTPSL